MSKKLLLILSVFILLVSLYFSKDKISFLNLGSSVLTTCDNDTLRKEKEGYQKKLSEVLAIDNFFRENKCSTISPGSDQGKMCNFLMEEKKRKEIDIQEYNSCRQQLYDRGVLDESPELLSISTEGIKIGTRQFIDPSYTCQSALSLKGQKPLYTTARVLEGAPIAASFDGGFYKKTNGTPSTIFKTHINPITQEQKWDPSFSFLEGDYAQIKEIVALQEYADETLYVVYKGTDDYYYLVQTDIHGIQSKNTQKIALDIADIKVSGEPSDRTDVLFLQEKKILIHAKDTNNTPKTFVMNLDGTNKIVWTKALPAYGSLLGQQPNGKILFAIGNNGVGRVDTSGLVDESYKMPIYNNKYCGLQNSGIRMLPDGTVVAFGNFTLVNDVLRNGLVRLDVDGEVDTGFDPGTSFKDLNSSGVSIDIMYDGQKKLIVTGTLKGYNGFEQNGIIRINLDGSPDTTFLSDSIPSELLGGLTYFKTQKVVGRNGDIIFSNYVVAPTRLIENKECFAGVEKKNTDSQKLNVCHKDDFSRGMVYLNNKYYISTDLAIKIFDTKGTQLKEIKRNPLFIGARQEGGPDVFMHPTAVVGKYIYFGSTFGVDIFDTETEEVIKLLGGRRLDTSSDVMSEPGVSLEVPAGKYFEGMPDGTWKSATISASSLDVSLIPKDALTTFVVGQDTYFIGQDRIIYKIVSTPAASFSAKNSGEFIVSGMKLIGTDLYAVTKDRLVIIDTISQHITHELKFSPGEYRWTGIDTFGTSQNNMEGPMLFANGKMYFESSGGNGAAQAHTSRRWFVVDVANKKLLKILKNTNEYTGDCKPYPFRFSAAFAKGKYIYFPKRKSDLYNCDLNAIDTETDAFIATVLPKDVEIELELMKNATDSLGGQSFRYAGHLFRWSGELAGYEIINLETGKKTGFIKMSVLYPNFPAMQRGNTLYFGTLFGNTNKIDLSSGVLSCED